MGPRNGWVGLAVGLLLVVPIAPGARAATAIERYVALRGVDTGDCSNQAAPCRTIQYAVDQAGPGDTVRIAAGTYVDTVNWKNGSYTNLPAGVSIVGAGPGKTIVNGPEPCGAGESVSKNTFFIGGTDVSLRSLSVGCASIGVQAFGSVTIDAVEFLATATMNLDSGYGPLLVTDSTFRGRIGIGNRGADLTVVGSTFETSQLAVVGAGDVPALRLTANRFPGDGVAISLSPGVEGTTFGSIDLTDNWWGCNDGPGATGCSTIDGIGFGTAAPWSWLRLEALSPPSTVQPGASVELTFRLVGSGTNAVATDFPPASVTFAADSGTVQPTNATLSKGLVNTTFTAPATHGAWRLTARLDNGTTTLAFNAPAPTPTQSTAEPVPATPVATPPPISSPPAAEPVDQELPITLCLVIVVTGIALVMTASA